MASGLSNQRRDLTGVLDDVPPGILREVAAAVWAEVRNHPAEASCECPALEALALLYERGFTLQRAELVSTSD